MNTIGIVIVVILGFAPILYRMNRRLSALEKTVESLQRSQDVHL